MRMETLAACPACGGAALEELCPYNDLRYLLRGGGSRDLARSDFVLCRRCGLMFARRRQTPAAFPEYYTRFAEWESRAYAVYPPPEAFIRGKVSAAVEIGRILAKLDLLRPGGRVLHVRADGGALMAHVRDHYGVTDIYGLDLFESNRRFAAAQYHLQNVAPLAYGDFRIPFESVTFDLIISNHLLMHACRPRDAFATLRQRLTPGGAIFLYNEYDHARAFVERAPFLRDGINNFHKQLFSADTLLTFLRLSGAEGQIVEKRNGSPLVVARPAAPMTVSTLPASDFTRQVDMVRSWAAAYERRWRWNLPRRLRRRYRVVDVVLAAVRRTERRLRGRADSVTSERPPRA
jgi:SAM-dependent methyltransferase